MEYPGFFVPHLSQPPALAPSTTNPSASPFHYPITPPYSNPYDTPPAVSHLRSAFTAVKSSKSGRSDYRSVELLHNLYANNFTTASGNAFFPTPPPYMPTTTTHTATGYPPSPPAQNSPTAICRGKPTAATMIERMLRRPRSPIFAVDDDDHHHHHRDDDEEDVICVDDENDMHMDRQRQDMVHRTSVIKSVIEADDRTYRMEEQRLLNPLMMRSAMQRMSSDSCGASSTSSGSTEDDIVCKWSGCFRPFDNLMQLATHVTHTHAIASPAGLYYCQWHSCPRADRGFNARYKMLVHVRTHTKEKPHRCQQCDKSFSRAENLKIHTRSHSGEKPYVCPVEGCTKAYSNSSDRFKHTRTHSTEKPYLCKVDGCNKRYTDPSSLRKHVKTFKHSLNPITFDDIVKPYRMASTEMVDLSPPEPDHRLAFSTHPFATGYGCTKTIGTTAALHRLDHLMEDVHLVPNRYTSGAYEAFVPASNYQDLPVKETKHTSTEYHSQSNDVPLDLSVQRQITVAQ